MNEELKIIIKAVTDSAKKEINKVSSELEGLSNAAKSTSGKMAVAFKGIALGAAGAVAAIAAISTALVALGKNTLQFQKEQAKLNAAFEAAGASAGQAAETYQDLYRFLGDSGKATEAANHLAMITTNQQHLAEWTKIAQGVYATFGDSLPIEGLTEAANETIRVGQVTGTLADALNWAGVSEDEFNAKLATTNSLEEREAMLRSTLNGLYSNAAEIYERNNAALLAYNESQARLDTTMAAAGAATMPLLTALNNLGTAFFSALKPALDAIIPPLATFINWIAKAINSVMAFFSALTGKSSTIKTIGEIGGAAKNLGSAAQGAKALGSGMKGAEKAAGGAAKAIEEAKKSTQGFDELNIVSSGSSSSGSSGGSGGGGGGSSSPGYASGGGSGLLDIATFGTEVEESKSLANGLADTVKKAFSGLADVFAPSIQAWSGAFDTIKQAWKEAAPDFISGATNIGEGISSVFKHYFTDYVPGIVNSFSTNIAPIFGDVVGFAIKELGKTFEWFGGIFNDVCNTIIIPTMDIIKMVYTDTFDIIGKLWAEHGQPLLDRVSEAYGNVREIITNIYEVVVKPIFEKLKKVFTDTWKNHFAPTIEAVLDALAEVGKTVLDIYNEFIYPVANWLIENILPIVVEVVGKMIDFGVKLFESMAQVIRGITQVIKGIAQFIGGVFTGDWTRAWEGIKNIFGGVWTAIQGIALYAWNYITGVFSVAGAFFGGIWETIKTVFSGAGKWFGGIFSDAWTAIRNVFSGWGSFFSGLWDKIKTTFSNLGTSIANAIGGAVKTGINGVISTIEKTINKAVDLINNAIDFINDLPIGVTIGKLKKVKFPRLAKGGVVDSATIAMIGEQGKEAVVPLENNTGWMDKLAERIAARNNNPTKVILKVGERELGWATIDAINGITEQTGGLQLAL